MVEQPQKSNSQEKTLNNIPLIQILHNLEHSTNQLEKTWSESLNNESVRKVHHEVLTLWESLRLNFPAWLNERSAKLQGLGFDMIINATFVQCGDNKNAKKFTWIGFTG